MLYRSLWRSGLLISVFVLGLASSTVNFAAPKASKESLDPRFHKLPPELRERLEKRMRARPQTKAAPTGRIPIKPPPAWIQQLGTPEYDVATAVAVGPQDNIYVTGTTSGTLGDQSYGNGNSDAWLAKYGPGRKLLWKVQLGSSSPDGSYGVAVDSKGYVYITGSTAGKLGSQQFGKEDAWVAKYSPSSKLLWKKQLGTAATDSSNGVATDRSGNVYLTGYTTRIPDAGPILSDIWVAKYNPNGKLLWKKQLGSSEIDVSRGIATDSNGNVYLTGETYGKLGDQQFGDDPSTSDAWFVKYNGSGKLLWKKQLGTPEADLSYGVATDRSGNVYLTGETFGKLGDQKYDKYHSDAWVAKYDSSGTQLWVKQLGTAPLWDSSRSVATDRSGNVYLTGETTGKLGDQQYGGMYEFDAWVAKYDSSGTQLWVKQLGSYYWDFSLGVAIDSKGNTYLAGSTDGKVGDQQYGSRDAWVAKYKP
jgi:hypothetical protein